ncbi:MAG TPA: IPT/TIG domain-containing protein [Solirubrobacteraceae bacterium]|nr:IPT/TIG domain-containing protein [Solirubrobacteraceae bacterium]
MDRATASSSRRWGAADRASGHAPARRALLAAAFAALLVVLALAAMLARPLVLSGGSPPGSAGRVLTSPGIPQAARAQVSAALGASAAAFHVRTVAPGTLSASNSRQGLTSEFTRAGVSVTAPTISLHLSLRSVGFGEGARRRPARAASPTAQANRVTYARGTLSEWYANGPAGLEQGFTVDRAPAPVADEPLTLELALSANARPTVAADGQSLTLAGRRATLRYGNLLSTDASGRVLRSWLSLQDGQLLIRVDAAHARYPLTIDPLIQVGGKLAAIDEQGDGLLGASVALSADGSTLLVGGPRDENAAHGAAWVFVREGSAWVQQGPKLTGAEAPSEEGGEDQCAEESPEEAGECAFGSSVALSADGDTALIGEPSASSLPGNAWVFERSGSKWSPEAVLTGEGGSWEGRFGKSVALSADGATALVGDPSASAQRGAGWVFTRAGSSWELQARLTDVEESHTAHVGRSAALSADGNTALLGGPGDSSFKGAAWAFTRSGTSWTQAPKSLRGEGASGPAHFGKAVALSGDGTTALIGGLTDAEGRGAVWPFARVGAGFVKQGEKITGTASGEPRFGYSVALSGDGATALVGSPRAELGGLVTVLRRSGSSWSADGEQLAGSGGFGKGGAGAATAISQDGNVIAIGAPRDGGRTGTVWLFTDAPLGTLPPPTVTDVNPGAGPAGTTVKIKGTNFTGAEAVLFDAQPATFVVKSALTIEAVAPPGLTGTVDVTVRTPSGVSAINPGDRFRYTTGAGGADAQGGSGSGAGAGSQGVLGSTSVGDPACRLTLRNKRLAVMGLRTVALRLARTGIGTCRGRLRLSFNRSKKGKRARLQTIGTTSFALGSASSSVLRITLNKKGRALFRGHHGRLNASLSIVRSLPAPTLARSSSVRLTWKKSKKVTLTR